MVKVHTACIDQRHVHEDTASFKYAVYIHVYNTDIIICVGASTSWGGGGGGGNCCKQKVIIDCLHV